MTCLEELLFCWRHPIDEQRASDPEANTASPGVNSGYIAQKETRRSTNAAIIFVHKPAFDMTMMETVPF